MDEKTLHTLEYFKVLEKLSGYTDFPVSAEMAHTLRPTTDLETAQRWQAETREALQLQTMHSDLTIGGARDIRSSIDLARHAGVLAPVELLDIKFTLLAARSLARSFGRMSLEYPTLAAMISRMPSPPGIVEAVSRTISEHGEIQDNASDRLAQIRRELRVSHERLVSKLQRMVSDPHNAPYLQDAIVTQRDGRYVLPLRAEFKGRIRSIVHDQSSSGATLFVEPLSVVELNNSYRELQLSERDEERRILAEISHLVGVHADLVEQVLYVVAEFDLALARGRYAEALRATQPVLRAFRPQPPGSRHPGSLIRINQARHPLLNPRSVVPIDVDLDDQTYVMIITGPNTGGKTVTLKTVGLLALMAQSGLHIPAHSGSEISLFDQLFADIGDEQSIEQSLSTFSGHITNIIQILQHADQHSLVILDELGAGTDPQEGAALARAILAHLLERGITTLVTTHHPELKAYAHSAAGVVNASVEFDLDTLRPTYHLTIGLPGRSNALAIAQRLGLPEPILADARSEISPDDLRAEDLLNEIHHQRDLSRQARRETDRALQEAEALRVQLASRLEKVEDERRAILEKARQESEMEINQLQAELREARRVLARARQPLDALQAVEEKVDALEEQVEAPVERRIPDIEQARKRAIRQGDKVRLRNLGMQGMVTSLAGDEVEVQVGVLRIRTHLADLDLQGGAAGGAAAARPAAPAVKTERSETRPALTEVRPVRKLDSAVSSPGLELDLRGQRAEDALDALERYLDSAFLAGLPFVRIIHGKGTGRLREVIRQALKQNDQVLSFESGGDKEGGEGVTVAKLAPS